MQIPNKKVVTTTKSDVDDSNTIDAADAAEVGNYDDAEEEDEEYSE